tara:strand:+ start:3306 stop:3698 length:393 start_codon:yes stop_codon:yes gene_type:complete
MMTFIIALAVIILAISLTSLLSMENSLEEGRGPQMDMLFMTIPLMILIAALMLLMANRYGRGPKQLASNRYSIIALMMTMFIIGMVIEPAIPRLPQPSDDTIGLVFVLVPILLIALMISPMGHKNIDEEE